MANRESDQAAQERWAKLKLLQEYYAEFEDLVIDVIEGVMGFHCSDIQLDIAKWVAYGSQYRMVQAQRGQAKTTIAAIYAVWRFIQDPTTRVLIISAGETQANEISNWIIQILNNMPELECLRADRSNGDRASVEAYDIHYTLKGPEKSPSVACVGITSNLQGKRADVLIPDDIESQKNSQTQVQKERVAHLTKDFTSICSNGDILWLGTPQSIDSLYNDLPGRGVALRIYPGRYPTVEEEAAYGAFLAPIIKSRIEADPTLRTGGGPTGDRGKAVETQFPGFLTEEILVKKEVDQGPSYFNLQHMLNTALTDAARFPLKIPDLRFLHWDVKGMTAPMGIEFNKHPGNMIILPNTASWKDPMYRVQEAADFGAVYGLRAYIDPAGGGINADEIAIAITGMCAGRVLLYDVVGRVGGVDETSLDWVVDQLVLWPNLKQVDIEENFGKGAFRQALQPKLLARLKKLNRPAMGLEDVWESGQKELRIIDILEPIIAAGKLLINEDLILKDIERCSVYPANLRSTYSFFWQLSRITKAKAALVHDDKLDAVAGAVRPWIESIAIDDEKARAAAKQVQYNKLMKDPLGNGRMPASFKQHGPFANLGWQGPNSLAWMNRR